MRIRGQLASGTARAGLKRAPADINTGFGGSGVAFGAQPNSMPPINGPYLNNNQSNMMDTTTMNIDTTSANITEQFHSPVNNDGMGVIDPEM